MVTPIISSRGSEESMENGMRSGLPATAKVGTSKLAISTSGRRESAPTGSAKTGTPFIRSRVAARDGASPVFQSPSVANTTAARRGCCSRRFINAAWRSVASGAGSSLEEKDSMTVSMRSASGFQSAGSVKGAAVSRRVRASAAGSWGLRISRVSMLPETSWSTATTGLELGLKVSRHSGWFRVMAIPTATRTRRISKMPMEVRQPLRRQANSANSATTRTNDSAPTTEVVVWVNTNSLVAGFMRVLRGGVRGVARRGVPAWKGGLPKSGRHP